MRVRAMIPDQDCLRASSVDVDDESAVATIHARSVAQSSSCPCCGQLSTRVHSHYKRKLKDLPWQGLSVGIVWTSSVLLRCR